MQKTDLNLRTMSLICENKRILKIGFFFGGGQYFPCEWLVEALMEDTGIQNTPTTGVKVMQTKSVSGKYKTCLGGSRRWYQGCT